VDSERRAVWPGVTAGQRTAELERLISTLEADFDRLVASTLEQLRDGLPRWLRESHCIWEEIDEFVRASLRFQLDGFRRGVLPDRPPDVDAAGAQATATVGELKVLLNGYRIAQMCLLEAWFDLVEGSVEPRQERHDMLRCGSEYFSRYAGLLSDYATDIYQREFERSVRTGEQRRFHAIKGLLEGDSLAGSQLDIDLEQHHLGFVGWGEGAEAGARELAATLGRRALMIAALNGSWWGWISGSRPLSPSEERQLEQFEPPAAAGLAFGLEAFGEAGFRATNRQALRARWVARRTHRSIVFYSDVAVEALASVNQDDARAFVARELRGIEDDSTTSQRIRETIVAYFAAEHNAASAAAALGVHQQTVANRLRAAEERLGRPVAGRRVELETALRLRVCLGRPA
jgi:PucR C-terminal helix-turn-helix domain